MRRMFSKNQIANMATVDGKDIEPNSVETGYLSCEDFASHGIIIENGGSGTVLDGQNKSDINGIIELTCNSLITGGINCDGASDCIIDGYMQVAMLYAGNAANDEYVKLDIPTSDPHEKNALWNDNGTLKISQG